MEVSIESHPGMVRLVSDLEIQWDCVAHVASILIRSATVRALIHEASSSLTNYLA